MLQCMEVFMTWTGFSVSGVRSLFSHYVLVGIKDGVVFDTTPEYLKSALSPCVFFIMHEKGQISYTPFKGEFRAAFQIPREEVREAHDCHGGFRHA